MKKKQALLTSGLCLGLSAALLAGTTFAWFTDSVTNEGNVIQSGELSIRAFGYVWDKEDQIWDSLNPLSKYTLIQETTWEPGQYNAVVVGVSNLHSTLAAKVELDFDLVSSTKDLEDALWYRITPYTSTRADFVSQDNIELNYLESRPSSTNANVTCMSKIEAEDGTTKVLDDENYAYYLIEYGMYTDAGNQYQGGSIDLDFTVLATQASYEEDGFGSADYDKDVTYIPDEVQSAAAGLETVVSGGTGTVGAEDTASTGGDNWFAAYADEAQMDYVAGFNADGDFVIRVKPYDITDENVTLGYVIANVRGENSEVKKAKIELNNVNSGHGEITEKFKDLDNGWYEWVVDTTGMGEEIGYIINVGYANQNGHKGEVYIRAASGWEWDSYVQVPNI